MKKVISLVMVFVMILSFGSGAFADKNYQQINIRELKPARELSVDLKNIPIYITTLNKQNSEVNKEIISNIIDENHTNNSIINSYNTKNNLLSIVNSDYRIEELSRQKREDVYINPLFSETLLRTQEMIDDGVDVKYINFFVNQENAINRGNMDDPKYWESQCEYLGSYNGYKFLFLESSVGIETNFVENGVSNSVSWSKLFGATVKTAVDVFATGYLETINTSFGIISNFSGIRRNPINVTYGESRGYVKARVNGDVYLRTILISDNQNRISGHAYYIWGHTEQARIKTDLDIKYPVSKRPGGTYNYENPILSGPYRTLSSPGFYGNSTLYRRIIDLYENKIGYFTHSEQLDLYGTIYDILVR